MNKDDIIGMKSINNQGLVMTVIDYKNAFDVTVVFEGYEDKPCKCSMANFKSGCVKNWFYPEIYNKGYIGDKFKIRSKNREFDFETKLYTMWHGMLERCYSEKSQKSPRNFSYIGCSVCEDWYYYVNFRDWVTSQSNFEFWKNEKYSIDKDIIKKGNKVYCKEFCTLVPHYINNLFTNHRSKRGKYPVGVTINCYGTFNAACSGMNGKSKHFGNFKTPE